ncbi:MAG: hypothetical protein IKR39_00215 [Lachnospiraceae bacterium]|nr:hypothetical protein [Lachnospiraceae bacterium]
MSKRNRRIFKKLYIALFVAMIFLPWIVWGGVRIFAPEFYAEQADISDEKRNKNELKFKDLLDSGESLSSYVDDRVPFRSGIINIYQNYEGKTEKVYQDAMRSVISFFSGKATEQKETVDLSTMLGGDGEGKESVSDNTLPVEETQGLDHEHSLAVIDKVDSTCDSPGYVRYKCVYCDYSKKEIIEPKPHDLMLIKESAVSYETYGYKEYMCRACGKLELKDFISKYVDNTYMAPQTVGGTLIGRYDWLFYADNSALDYYTGSNVLSEEEMKNYADKVNRLYDLCSQRGMSVLIMFMPNKEQVYPEYLPTMEVVNRYKREQQLIDYLGANTYVPCLYPLEELKAAEVFWPVYYKYDSHWNHMGAFVALQSIYKVIGIETTNPMLIGAPACTSERNDLILLGGLSRENYPAEIEYKPEYKNDVIVNGLDPLADICHTYSTSPNNRKLVLLADSFRELITPYITKDFSECVIAHRKYTDNMAEDIKNCNVLILAAVEREDKDLFNCIDKVIAILESQ